MKPINMAEEQIKQTAAKSYTKWLNTCTEKGCLDCEREAIATEAQKALLNRLEQRMNELTKHYNYKYAYEIIVSELRQQLEKGG